MKHKIISVLEPIKIFGKIEHATHTCWVAQTLYLLAGNTEFKQTIINELKLINQECGTHFKAEQFLKTASEVNPLTATQPKPIPAFNNNLKNQDFNDIFSTDPKFQPISIFLADISRGYARNKNLYLNYKTVSVSKNDFYEMFVCLSIIKILCNNWLLKDLKNMINQKKYINNFNLDNFIINNQQLKDLKNQQKHKEFFVRFLSQLLDQIPKNNHENFLNDVIDKMRYTIKKERCSIFNANNCDEKNIIGIGKTLDLIYFLYPVLTRIERGKTITKEEIEMLTKKGRLGIYGSFGSVSNTLKKIKDRFRTDYSKKVFMRKYRLLIRDKNNNLIYEKVKNTPSKRIPESKNDVYEKDGIKGNTLLPRNTSPFTIQEFIDSYFYEIKDTNFDCKINGITYHINKLKQVTIFQNEPPEYFYIPRDSTFKDTIQLSSIVTIPYRKTIDKEPKPLKYGIYKILIGNGVHYWSYINLNNNWYLFDDFPSLYGRGKHITPISEKDVLENSKDNWAYLVIKKLISRVFYNKSL